MFSLRNMCCKAQTTPRMPRILMQGSEVGVLYRETCHERYAEYEVRYNGKRKYVCRECFKKEFMEEGEIREDVNRIVLLEV